jgi:chromosome segregation ATPase
LRQENAKKVKALSDQLKKSGLKIAQLDAMVQGLLQSIQEKEEQISILESDLVSLDKAYARLFDAYQEKAVLVDELTEEINTVYYSYGTEEELVKNKVIDRKNGFIGIGKSIKLMDNFNQKYFAKIDLTEEKELFIEGSELKFITDHPSSSYSLSPSGKNTKIKISNPREFWKVSRYLVIVVD